LSKLLLVDGNSIMNRAFFGIPILTNSEGEYTNAIYGFINIITRIMEEEKATNLVVSFDLKGPTFRTKMFKAYKGTRKGMPEELRPQMKMVKEVLKSMNVTICEMEGYEADDVLGTLSKLGEEAGYDVALLSGDRDMLQLATKKVEIIIPKTSKGTTTYRHYFDKDVMDLYSVTPTEFIDIKGLMGDTSDNIPGIPGVGEKTAIKLISQYHSIEAAYEARETFAKGLKAKMTEHYEQALMSRELATIITDCPLEVSLEDTTIEDMYTKEAFDWFVRLNLNSHLDKFGGMGQEPEKEVTIETITSMARARMQMISASSCRYHLFYDASRAGVAYTFGDDLYYYTDDSIVSREELYSFIKDIVADDTIAKVTHDYKLQLHEIKAPISLEAMNVEDISLMMYLINPVAGHYEIDKIASEFGAMSYISDEAFLGKGRSKKTYADFSQEELMDRQITALRVIERAYPKIKTEVEEKGLD